MLARLAAIWADFPFQPSELCCHKTSLNFVDSICEIFAPLGSGVPLLIVGASARSDPEELIELLARHGVSRITLVPSLLRALLDVRADLGHALPALRSWVTSARPSRSSSHRGANWRNLRSLSLVPARLSRPHSTPRVTLLGCAHRFVAAAPSATLLNLYGCTEVAADCMWARVEPPRECAPKRGRR